MHELMAGDEISAFEAYRVAERTNLVRGAAVTTIDGAATDEDGWTNSLGGPEDLAVLSAIRAHSDAVLVGAGTVRTGRLPPLCRVSRDAPPGSPIPPFVFVSNGLDFDFDSPTFTRSTHRPLIMAPADAARRDPVRARELGERLLVVGNSRVDLSDGVTALRERGFTRITCEGGPTLLNSMLDCDLIDELCLTLTAHVLPVREKLVSTTSDRQNYTLGHVRRSGADLYLIYRRSR